MMAMAQQPLGFTASLKRSQRDQSHELDAQTAASGRKRPAAGDVSDAASGAVCLPCEPAGSDSEDNDDDPPRVCYISSDKLLRAAAMHPQHPLRPFLIHELLVATRIVDSMDTVEECDIDKTDLAKFHSRGYVDFLRKPKEEDHAEYGCDFDCPCFPQIWVSQ